MTDKTGGPAFPQHDQDSQGIFTTHPGMTLRDYFAAKAMQGMLAGSMADGSELDENSVYLIPAAAYKFADAMLKEREK